ncbi:MAG TPA: hypothetical protein VLU25_03325 [Acidobacteriota bacterium]|nr:hypothetical protein [Acidobacteriota bacterium]
MSQQKKTIASALRKAESWLDEIDGVEGVGQGKSGQEDCITVFVSHEAVAEKLPKELDGFKVVVSAGGHFQALS